FVWWFVYVVYCFFFQAEDGIRDFHVTGVQTCALPISVAQLAAGRPFGQWPGGVAPWANVVSSRIINDNPPTDDGSGQGNEVHAEIGRASCRVRVRSGGVVERVLTDRQSGYSF